MIVRYLYAQGYLLPSFQALSAAMAQQTNNTPAASPTDLAVSPTPLVSANTAGTEEMSPPPPESPEATTGCEPSASVTDNPSGVSETMMEVSGMVLEAF